MFEDFAITISVLNPCLNFLRTLAADFLLKWIPKLNQSYEPPKNEEIKGKTPAFDDVHPIRLRVVSHVRTEIEAYDGYIHIPKLEAIEA